MKKIYLAGYDVFYEDAAERGKKLKALCRKYGFEGLFPLDSEAKTAEEIFSANIGLIDEADIIAANLNDFRGNDPDSGTTFELGYAYARKKALYGYRDSLEPLRDRLGERDGQGFSVEDFGMSINLMPGCCCIIVEGDAEACLKRIKEDNL